MQLFKPVMQNTNHFDYLYEYINKNKNSKKKIILFVDLEKIKYKFLRKIKHKEILNIQTIINSFTDKEHLKKFIKSL